jgi:putative intracellular protease/amidase
MKYLLSMILLLTLNSNATSQLIPQEPRNVGIFLYEGVELLDFAGPGEVFSASGFNTFTLSVDGQTITSQRFVEIKPQYSIDNAPTPDIIVFPGGNAGPSANDPNIVAWIKKLNYDGTQFMSVCTGAFILARAGLLENKSVTTHWGSTKSLAQKYPATTVLEDTRWVDHGSVITTAGVSAGIDGALHFVARVKGEEAARNTARYMEYDKWIPAEGVIDGEHEYLANFLRSSPGSKQDNSASTPKDTKAPYVGEFINLANTLLAQGDYATAEKIVEAGVKVYPGSAALFKVLGMINRKSGKPAPVEEAALVNMVRAGKVDEAIAQFEKNKIAFPTWRTYNENELKDAAYYLLLEKKDYAGAIKIFKLNTQEFPDSADAFDSLGEALIAAGKRKEGIDNYKIAASMGYANAKKVLRELGIE